MPKIADYFKILNDEEVKDFVVINFGECFKFTREALHSKLGEEENIRKVAELFYSFLKTSDEKQKMLS